MSKGHSVQEHFVHVAFCPGHYVQGTLCLFPNTVNLIIPIHFFTQSLSSFSNALSCVATIQDAT